MKYIFGILILLNFITLETSYGQTDGATKIAYTVDFDYLEGCETGLGNCKPITITRRSIDDSIVVIFPSGGTQSDAYIYASLKDDKLMSDSNSGNPIKILHDRKFIGEGNPQLDITGLSDGNYTASLVSCGLGGTFQLMIKTDK